MYHRPMRRLVIGLALLGVWVGGCSKAMRDEACACTDLACAEKVEVMHEAAKCVVDLGVD